MAHHAKPNRPAVKPWHSIFQCNVQQYSLLYTKPGGSRLPLVKWVPISVLVALLLAEGFRNALAQFDIGYRVVEGPVQYAQHPGAIEVAAGSSTPRPSAHG